MDNRPAIISNLKPPYILPDDVWTWLCDLWTAVRPARFSLLAILLVWLVLQFTGQGKDFLIAVGEDAEVWGIQTLWLKLNSKPAGLAVWTIILGIYVWYWARRAVTFRFDREVRIMLRYRTEFPAVRYANADGSDRRAAAKRRVGRILKNRKWLPRILGALSFLAVAGPLWTLDFGWLGFTILNLGAVTFLLFWQRRPIVNSVARGAAAESPFGDVQSRWGRLHHWTKCAMLVLASILIIFALLLLVAPITFGGGFGAIAVFFAVACGFVTAGTLLAMATRRYGVPAFTIVLILFSVPAHIWDNHGVRKVEDSGGWIEKRPTVAHAAKAWLEANVVGEGNFDVACSTAGSTNDEKASKPIPLILVATAGGGSRAAYWTTMVLGRLQDEWPLFKNYLFSISGVSGGSLGAVVFRAALARDDALGGALQGSFEAHGRKALEADFLGPTLAAMFTRDLIHPLVPFVSFPDRAAVLETAWEVAWREGFADKPPPEEKPDDLLAERFLSLWRFPSGDPARNGAGSWPALLLNGSIVTTGERTVISNLRLNGARDRLLADDALDAVGHDLRLSTAAAHSARFPIVGPAGLMRRSAKQGEEERWFRVVDGGYFENFGATTTREVLEAAMDAFGDCRSRVVPYVLQISSDPSLDPDVFDAPPAYEARFRTNSFLPQLRAPLTTYLATRGAHGIGAVNDLDQLAEKFDGDMLHFELCVPSDGRDPREPPLGWALSKAARDDIAEAFNCGNNAADLKTVLRLSPE